MKEGTGRRWGTGWGKGGEGWEEAERVAEKTPARRWERRCTEREPWLYSLEKGGRRGEKREANRFSVSPMTHLLRRRSVKCISWPGLAWLGLAWLDASQAKPKPKPKLPSPTWNDRPPRALFFHPSLSSLSSGHAHFLRSPLRRRRRKSASQWYSCMPKSLSTIYHLFVSHLVSMMQQRRKHSEMWILFCDAIYFRIVLLFFIRALFSLSLFLVLVVGEF